MADDQIPERVAASPDHPDFYPRAYRLLVLLDGQPMRGVTWADRVAGVVEFFAVDDRGRSIVLAGHFLTRTAHGEVRFLVRGGDRGR